DLEGLRRAAAPARQRAAHLHPRGRIAFPDREGQGRGTGRAGGRGAAHPVERVARGGGTRGHARRGHLLAAARGLAEPHGRLLPQEVRRVVTPCNDPGKAVAGWTWG